MILDSNINGLCNNCIRIYGGDGQYNRYIIRSITNNHLKCKIKFDVIPWGIYGDKNKYCAVSYSFDKNIWIELNKYFGNNGNLTPYIDEEFIFNNIDTTASELYIKLEAIGNCNGELDGYDDCMEVHEIPIFL